MEELQQRTREWIHKPTFPSPPPISWAQEYFRGRIAQFRKEHPQFDVFLIEINKLIKAEHNSDFANLEKFIDGKAETNWISPSNAMFDAFIKLFNLCLSPKQALDYIKECCVAYEEMLSIDYQLCGTPRISIRRSEWDGKVSKFISFTIVPIKNSPNHDYSYWFNITADLNVAKEDADGIIGEFKIKRGCEKIEDTLMLFEYYQDKNLLRKVFSVGIKELIAQGSVEEITWRDSDGEVLHKYETNLEISDIED